MFSRLFRRQHQQLEQRVGTEAEVSAPQSFQHVWWVIDPFDPHGCCPDCQRYAASSPYNAPWFRDHVLDAIPGDGRTACGSFCTCSLSYDPPERRQSMAPPIWHTARERAYHQLNYRQKRFVYEYGLDRVQINAQDQIRGVILADGRWLKAADDQYFVVADNGTLQLWEDDVEVPPRAYGDRALNHEQLLVQEWTGVEVMWILAEGATELLVQSWPDLPEWDEEGEQRARAEDLHQRMAWRFAQGVLDPWDEAVVQVQRTHQGLYDVYSRLRNEAIARHSAPQG